MVEVHARFEKRRRKVLEHGLDDCHFGRQQGC